MGKLVGILVTLSAFVFLGCGGSAKPKIEKPRVHQSIIDLERGKIKGQDYGAFETKNLQKIYDLVIPHLGKV
ncbi:MAG: hypothetical protein OIF32_06300 [Campylobacterales bacterium]|nr:hypothetical protein [Campylobacterales bacterium]